MQLQSRLLTVAIVSALAVSALAISDLAVSAPAFAASANQAAAAAPARAATAMQASAAAPAFSAIAMQAPAATPARAATAIQASAAVRAQGLVDGPAATAVKRASADRFASREALVDADGTEHVRFARTYRGLPVIGGDFVLHSKNGQLKSVSQTLKTNARPDIVPQVSSSRAIVEAGARFGTGFTGVPESRLVVYALGAAPVLAHEVTFSGFKADRTPTDMHYFVDARTGKVLGDWDTIETVIGPGPGTGGSCADAVAAVGTGNTLSEGVVTLNTAKCGLQYQMLDTTRGGGSVTNMGQLTTGNGTIFIDPDNVWGNGGVTNAASAAAEAHYGAAVTWDMYKALGRNGIANDGKGAPSRVHYDRNYVNAFWSDACFCMTYGDGDGVTTKSLTALDVVGHEMSHGVNSRTADLVYTGEAGGLNEANSDIMGSMAEHFARNPSDPADYLIGENIYLNNTGTRALRYMFKPSLNRNQPDCWSTTVRTKGPHTASGVGNHFFYLLAQGAVVPSGFGAGTSANLTPSKLVCNSNTTIQGIGPRAAALIWFRAHTVYMTSNTTYAGARAATLSAAADLYGAGSTNYNAVAAAWSAVLVN